jgi:uncharacterized protein YqjF (DUF2071 family)
VVPEPTNLMDVVAHRPWPLPRRRWIMRQTWNDLLFSHWPLHPDQLRPKLPPGLTLDLFDGRAWLGIVPFEMADVAPRAMPALPWLSRFPELNVRTYVTVDDTPGVYFFSLDAASRLAVLGARALLNLPYYLASMQIERRAHVRYRSRRAGAAGGLGEFTATYQPAGATFQPSRGSLEYFLTERYCLYGASRHGALYRLEIHHPPWDLQPAEAEIARNTMADAAGMTLPRGAPLLHFARQQRMIAWPSSTISARR